jgi:hypothetical protein
MIVKRVYGAESMKQLEIEVLASSQGVVDFIETLNSIYPEKENVLSTLRIHEMDKVLKSHLIRLLIILVYIL